MEIVICTYLVICRWIPKFINRFQIWVTDTHFIALTTDKQQMQFWPVIASAYVMTDEYDFLLCLGYKRYYFRSWTHAHLYHKNIMDIS